jgi:Flp pilus assembly protein TadD
MRSSSLTVAARAILLVLLWAAHGASQADESAEIRALVARGDLSAALPRAEKAALAEPADAQARFLHGVVLMDLKRDDEAMAVFASLAQEYPELPDPLNNMALLHARAGRLELARQALTAALRNEPGHRAALANLGQVHLMLAVQSWEQANAAGVVDPQLLRRLEGARKLLAATALSAR